MSKREGISNSSINVMADTAWYYENRGSINLIIDTTKYGVDPGIIQIRIPSRLLRRTIERQQYTKRKKGTR